MKRSKTSFIFKVSTTIESLFANAAKKKKQGTYVAK